MTKLLLSFVLSAALAAPSTPAPDLESIRRDHVEMNMRRGLSYAHLRSTLADQFKTPADVAYLEKSFPATPKDADLTFKPREFHAVANGYSITAPNGRAFTVTTDEKSAAAVFVNGRKIALSKISLETYADRVNAALHRTFVTKHWPWSWLAIDRAEAVFVGLTLALVGVVTYMSWKAVRKGGGYEERVISAYASFGKNCEIDRKAKNAHFVGSVTADTLEKLQKAGFITAEAVANGTKNCEGMKLEKTLMLDQNYFTPKFSDESKERACEEVRKYLKCTLAYRQDEDPGALISGFGEDKTPMIER